MKVYCDNDNCKWHARQLDLDYSLHFYAESQPIAFFEAPWNFASDGPAWIERVKHAQQNCQQVVIICNEIHDDTYQWIQQFRYDNVLFAICGELNQFNNLTYMDWFQRTVKHYKDGKLLQDLQPYAHKEKCFDVLLGRTRKHRSRIWRWFHTAPNERHLEYNILTYIGTHKSFINEPGVRFTSLQPTLEHTIQEVIYKGHRMSYSQIVPTSLYNQTAYSLVTETTHHNGYCFMTEKIVKPILAERFFMVYTGTGYLAKLRELGFRTFSDLVDESYDEEPDLDKRWMTIAQNFNYMCMMQTNFVQESLKPILKHNKECMLETDWLAQFHKQLDQII